MWQPCLGMRVATAPQQDGSCLAAVPRAHACCLHECGVVCCPPGCTSQFQHRKLASNNLQLLLTRCCYCLSLGCP